MVCGCKPPLALPENCGAPRDPKTLTVNVRENIFFRFIQKYVVSP